MGFHNDLGRIMAQARYLPDGAWLSMDLDSKGNLRAYLWAKNSCVDSFNSEYSDNVGPFLSRMIAFCDGDLVLVEKTETTYTLGAKNGN